MAKEILRDVFISVNGTDLSDHCSQVEIDQSAAVVDVTSFGAANTENLLGIGDASVAATFFQDFASKSVDATLAPLQGSNTPFEVIVRPKKSNPVSTDNQNYHMFAVLPDYKALSGSIGAASTVQVTFQNADQMGIDVDSGS